MSEARATPSQPLAAEASKRKGLSPYVRTWFWLLILTLIELAVVILPGPRGVLVTLLVVLALMKGGLIMAEFMHLRFEQLSFIYAMLSPLLLAVALLAGIFPDALTRLP
ncbi:MAG TPA: cytochrome C oxidase subunit IV family protein [Limnochorda sp.]